MMWKRWKRGPKRFRELRRLDVTGDLVAQTAGSRKGVWHVSRSPALNYAMPRAYWRELGVPALVIKTT